jgi:hypothetical protein
MQTGSMAKVFFTANIQRHVVCPETEVAGRSVREVLDNVFAGNPKARSTCSMTRRCAAMTIFVDGHAIRDRTRLSDPVRRTARPRFPGFVGRLSMRRPARFNCRAVQVVQAQLGHRARRLLGDNVSLR